MSTNFAIRRDKGSQQRNEDELFKWMISMEGVSGLTSVKSQSEKTEIIFTSFRQTETTRLHAYT